MHRNFTQKKLRKIQMHSNNAAAKIWAAAFFVLVALPTGLALSAQVHAATRNFGVTGFDSVKLEAPYQVTIILGNSAGAVAEGPPEAFDTIIMEVNDNVLTIREKPRDSKQARRTAGQPIRITVRAPARLRSIAIGGFGSVTVSGLTAPNLALSLSGAGSMTANIKKSDTLQLALNGSGTMTISGNARSLSASLSGNGQILADTLFVRQADVQQAGAGAARYQVSEFAVLSAQGLGTLDITGRGYCRIKQDGGTTIRCAGRILPAK
jgi:Putative auto-transporter adhesin, head GIN domain